MYRKVERMTVEEMERERSLIEPFIRDVLTCKQERKRELSLEISRRKQATGE